VTKRVGRSRSPHAGQQVESSGDTAGPDGRDLDGSRAFARFCETVVRLVGRREFAWRGYGALREFLQ
jgi:hypothetical protein